MALKKRNRVEATFAMSSMTDLVFLLLLFFVMASTMSSPNDIKINLPQSRATQSTHPLTAKVYIDNQGTDNVYSLQLFENGRVKTNTTEINKESLEARLKEIQSQDSTMCVSLNADEDIPYKEIMYVLDIANQNHMKLVVATSKPRE